MPEVDDEVSEIDISVFKSLKNQFTQYYLIKMYCIINDTKDETGKEFYSDIEKSIKEIMDDNTIPNNNYVSQITSNLEYLFKLQNQMPQLLKKLITFYVKRNILKIINNNAEQEFFFNNNKKDMKSDLSELRSYCKDQYKGDAFKEIDIDNDTDYNNYILEDPIKLFDCDICSIVGSPIVGSPVDPIIPQASPQILTSRIGAINCKNTENVKLEAELTKLQLEFDAAIKESNVKAQEAAAEMAEAGRAVEIARKNIGEQQEEANAANDAKDAKEAELEAAIEAKDAKEAELKVANEAKDAKEAELKTAKDAAEAALIAAKEAELTAANKAKDTAKANLEAAKEAKDTAEANLEAAIEAKDTAETAAYCC